MPHIAVEKSRESTANRVLGYRVLSIGIKAIIAILSIGFIYHEIFYNKDIAAIQVFATNIFGSTLDYVLLSTVVVLMMVNWTLESLKWRYLIEKIEAISVSRALKAIFSGASVSIFTPNRIGDFGARVFYLDNSDRIKAVFITIVGSISQLVVTILTGILAMGIYLIAIRKESIDPVLGYVFFGVLSLSGILVVVSYYNVFALTEWGKKLFRLLRIPKRAKITAKIKEYVEVFSLYSPGELTVTLFYSLIRYLVFSTQFFILMSIFNVELPALSAYALISLTFFAMAVIPTVALTEIGVRGSVALFFLGLVSDNSIGIITATFALWLINLALPALIGSFFVFGANIFKARNGTSNPDQ